MESLSVMVRRKEGEEGEVEQEVEENKEEDNNQTPVRMSMNEMD